MLKKISYQIKFISYIYQSLSLLHILLPRFLVILIPKIVVKKDYWFCSLQLFNIITYCNNIAYCSIRYTKTLFEDSNSGYISIKCRAPHLYRQSRYKRTIIRFMEKGIFVINIILNIIMRYILYSSDQIRCVVMGWGNSEFGDIQVEISALMYTRWLIYERKTYGMRGWCVLGKPLDCIQCDFILMYLWW